MLFAFRRRALLARALGMVVALNLLPGVVPGLQAAAPAARDDGLAGLCRVDQLPADIRGSLSRNFSTWKVQEPKDLSVRARTRWGAERPLTCPGIAAGNFKNPRSASYAVLLVPANHASSGFRLLIYSPASGQTSGQQFYGFKAVATDSNGGSDLFISAVPAAHSKVPEAVMLVDSAAPQAFLYVWSQTSYERQPVNYP